jgi:pyruvate formate lyase activating enzyme
MTASAGAVGPMREVCNALQGYVHSVETGGTLDGPGIRFVLFLNGCPLRCQYCHNPDTWLLRHGTLRGVEEILAEIRGYADFLKRAKGGVTLSGGEPLMQPRFVESILRGAKEMGLHTVLDTSGHLHEHAPDSLLDAVDLVLLDIKSGDEETHRRVTGKPLQPTLDFAARLQRMHKPMWARFVLVPGLTDAEDNVRNVAKIIAGLDTVQRVEILPFHQLASFKYEQLGIRYPLQDKAPADPRDVVMAWRIFSEEGVFGTR